MTLDKVNLQAMNARTPQKIQIPFLNAMKKRVMKLKLLKIVLQKKEKMKWKSLKSPISYKLNSQAKVMETLPILVAALVKQLQLQL